MENTSKTEGFEDPDFFINVKNTIERELYNIQKLINNISQLRGKTGVFRYLK